MSSEEQPYRHMLFMLQAIEFLLSKISQLYQLQTQEQTLRKKSSIRIIDRSIQRLPQAQLKLEPIHVPLFQDCQTLMKEIETHKRSLQVSLENMELNVQQSYARDLRILKERVSTVQFQLKHLSCDVGELIVLYKQLAIA